MFHRFNDGKHFAVVSVVVAFRGSTFAGPEGDGVKLIFVGLGNDSGDCEARGISMEGDREFRVEVSENWGRGEQGLQLVKGFLSSRIPFEVSTLAEKRRDWDDNSRITDYEPAVEIGEAKKDLDFGKRTWNGRFGDGSNAVSTHMNAVRGNDKPEEIDFLNMELAFLEFNV